MDARANFNFTVAVQIAIDYIADDLIDASAGVFSIERILNKRTFMCPSVDTRMRIVKFDLKLEADAHL